MWAIFAWLDVSRGAFLAYQAGLLPTWSRASLSFLGGGIHHVWRSPLRNGLRRLRACHDNSPHLKGNNPKTVSYFPPSTFFLLILFPTLCLRPFFFRRWGEKKKKRDFRALRCSNVFSYRQFWRKRHTPPLIQNFGAEIWSTFLSFSFFLLMLPLGANRPQTTNLTVLQKQGWDVSEEQGFGNKRTFGFIYTGWIVWVCVCTLWPPPLLLQWNPGPAIMAVMALWKASQHTAIVFFFIIILQNTWTIKTLNTSCVIQCICAITQTMTAHVLM